MPAAADISSDDVVGTVPWLLSATSDRIALYEECNLGSACADSVRYAFNTDLAIVNGGDLTGNLPPGELTYEFFYEAIPDGLTLATTTVSITQLKEILESALSHVVMAADRSYDVELSKHGAFPQISGFTLAYDPSQPAGDRLVWLKVNGNAVDFNDLERSFTLAATENMLSGGYEMPVVPEAESSDLTLRDTMEQYIRSGLDDYSRQPLQPKRITVVGLKMNSEQMISIMLFLAVVCIIIGLLYPFWRKRRRFLNRDY